MSRTRINPVINLYLPGLNKKLEIFYMGNTKKFYTNSKYYMKDFNFKTRTIQERYIRIFEDDETIPGLLKKVRDKISFSKNNFNRRNSNFLWKSLVYLTKEIERATPQLNDEVIN